MTDVIDDMDGDVKDLKDDKLKSEKESVIEENNEILDHIDWLCNRWDREDERILLFGNIGAGKSSIINTIIKALSGTYIPKARVGQGSTQSKTFSLERYISCGVTKEDMREKQSQYLQVESLVRLPTIFDVAGKSNTDSEELEEILELLIGGHVQPGTSIEALTRLQEEHEVGSLKNTILKKSRQEWKMTKIVFVHSCRDKVPDKLIDCLLRILRKSDPRTALPKYSADVYVVLSKYDLVKDKNSYKWSSNEPTVTYEEFQEIEKEIEQKFSIMGSLEDNRTRWVSYTDATGKDNPYIDNITLKFIKRMLMPRNNDAKSVKTVLSPWTKMELKMKKSWRNAKCSFKERRFTISLAKLSVCILIAIFVFAFLYYVYSTLNSPPTRYRG